MAAIKTRAMALDGAIPVAATEPPRVQVGLMGVSRWRAEGHAARDSRVLLDGVDVTDVVYLFDDIEGWAELWVDDVAGRYRIVKRGRLEVVIGTRFGPARGDRWI